MIYTRLATPIMVHTPESASEDDLPPLPVDVETWSRVMDTLPLSPRQRLIVELIHRRMKDKEIAAHLGIRPRTVREHLTRIFDRLGVADRVELILLVFARSHEPRDVNARCRRK